MAVVTQGIRAKQPISGAASTTHNFNGKMFGYVLMNDGSTDITITVNTDTFTIKAGEVFDEFLEPFTSVTITNSNNAAFRAYGRG